MSVTTYDLDAQGIALLRLDRPDARNALNTELLVEILEHLDAARGDGSARVLVVSSTDQMALSAGADVREQLDDDGRVHRMELFARLYDVPRLERKERVDESLDAMGLTDAADRIAGTYSGGMIRRLELAQALVGDPRLLVLDEPTIGLDPVAREGVWDRILELRRVTDMTVLITTHYMDEADSACDRVALMNRGQIVEIGTPTGLKQRLGDGATLDDVFRHHTGAVVDEGGDVRDVASVRRTAHRLG